MSDRPDWLIVLDQKCEETSQAQVGRELDVASSSLGQVRNGKYPASTDAIEARVRGRYMNHCYTCPALGFEITSHRCAELQRGNVSASIGIRGQLRRTCPTCEHRTGR
ncbi:MAG: hypothetical protein ACFB0G_01035 [Leptolyngbyaceae cyanobacterium]